MTPAGPDAGADVRATGAVAQVKHHLAPVGQPVLRDLFGVAGAAAARPFCYSLSGYTAQALEWAVHTDMALFTYSLDGSVRPANAAAQAVGVATGPAPGGRRLGFFEQVRADRYRREYATLRRHLESLTVLMQKRTQSRRASVRQKAGAVAPVLTQASRTLDAGDALPPADRRRDDFLKAVRDALNVVKKAL